MNTHLLMMRGAVASMPQEDQDKFAKVKDAVAAFTDEQFTKHDLDTDLKCGLLSMIALEATE